jgi:hypothetical protein
MNTVGDIINIDGEKYKIVFSDCKYVLERHVGYRVGDLVKINNHPYIIAKYFDVVYCFISLIDGNRLDDRFIPVKDEKEITDSEIRAMVDDDMVDLTKIDTDEVCKLMADYRIGE